MVLSGKSSSLPFKFEIIPKGDSSLTYHNSDFLNAGKAIKKFMELAKKSATEADDIVTDFRESLMEHFPYGSEELRESRIFDPAFNLFLESAGKSDFPGNEDYNFIARYVVELTASQRLINAVFSKADRWFLENEGLVDKHQREGSLEFNFQISSKMKDASHMDTIIEKWKNRGVEFTHDQSSDSNKFCIHLTDRGGFGPCSSETETSVYFESPKDFFGWIRYSEIPNIIMWDTGKHDEIKGNQANILEYCDEYTAKNVGMLLKGLDSLLGLDKFTADMMQKTIDFFNSCFANTNPAVQILAWGFSVRDFICHEFFKDAFEEEILENENVDIKKLYDLLKNDAFEEENKEHISLADGLIDYCTNA